jgi:hypothetical protein
MENSEFFKVIVEATKKSNDIHTLQLESQILFSLIVNDYQTNIRFAAENGYNEAYLCIYKVGALYDGKISIDSYIRMSKSQIQKFLDSGTQVIMDQLRKDLYPFQIKVHQNLENDIILILATW